MFIFFGFNYNCLYLVLIMVVVFFGGVMILVFEYLHDPVGDHNEGNQDSTKHNVQVHQQFEKSYTPEVPILEFEIPMKQPQMLSLECAVSTP